MTAVTHKLGTEPESADPNVESNALPTKASLSLIINRIVSAHDLALLTLDTRAALQRAIILIYDPDTTFSITILNKLALRLI